MCHLLLRSCFAAMGNVCLLCNILGISEDYFGRGSAGRYTVGSCADEDCSGAEGEMDTDEVFIPPRC
jgi:hypothetical protein